MKTEKCVYGKPLACANKKCEWCQGYGYCPYADKIEEKGGDN